MFSNRKVINAVQTNPQPRAASLAPVAWPDRHPPHPAVANGLPAPENW
jgi:hypothetical protein